VNKSMGSVPSVMKHSFSHVPSANIQRSSFDRSHGFKTTFDGGYLIPVFWDMAVPGDTMALRATMFARLNTPIVPFMDNMRLTSFFFAVPVRLVWDNFQKMMGEQIDPGDSIDFLAPIMTWPAGGYTIGSIADYLGWPTGNLGTGYGAVSLWHRAYNLIWNEWFRDQNIQDSVVVDRDDGPDDSTDYVLLRRGKRHDYFTACLPWPQKGDSVTLPLGTEAPITSKQWDQTSPTVGGGNVYFKFAETGAQFGRAGINDGSPDPMSLLNSTGSPGTNETLQWPQVGDMPPSGGTDGIGYNYADLSEATAATINALRLAFQQQRMLEKDARGGTRYTEIIMSHFGVRSPDARLQRPEYLGGGVTPVSVSPIAQTSGTAASGTTTPLGNLAAMGIVSASGHGFNKSFTEHTLLLGLVSVQADLNYQQGLNRLFSARTREEYYWPSFAHIGEQAVLNGEIYMQGTATDSEVFGYQERYAEMRYKPSQITGLFRSTAASNVDEWHLAQQFTALPELLDPDFIQDDPPIDRVIATPDQPHFKLDVYFNYRCARPMPMFSVPGLIDHF